MGVKIRKRRIYHGQKGEQKKTVKKSRGFYFS